MDGVPEVEGKERQDASSYEEQIEGPGSHVDYTIEGDEGVIQGTDFLGFWSIVCQVFVWRKRFRGKSGGLEHVCTHFTDGC